MTPLLVICSITYVLFAIAGIPLWNAPGILCAIAFSMFCAEIVNRLTK